MPYRPITAHWHFHNSRIPYILEPDRSFGSPLTLSSNLFLSPLAGYTNLPFRLVVRRNRRRGPVCTTDLVNARSLSRDSASGRSKLD